MAFFNDVRSIIPSMIAGCGNSTSDTDSGKTTTEGSKGSDKKVEIRVMAYNAESTRATYLKLLEEKLPNIKVTFEFVALDNFNNVLNSQLQAGQGPDIIEVGGETRLLANAGYLMDLTGEEFTSKYADSGLAPYSVDGKVFATPLQIGMKVFFITKLCSVITAFKFRKHLISLLRFIRTSLPKGQNLKQWVHSLGSL